MTKKLTTDAQSELITEVDKNNKVIGSISRGVAHNSPDKIYRTVFVVVKDKDNKILLQKRSSTKDLYPECWDLSVGGHVDYGKSYLETAIRELAEELGIVAFENDLKLIGEVLVNLPESNEFFQVFEYYLKPNDTIKIETEEVDKTTWMTIDQIKESMKKERYRWYPRPLQVVAALY